MWESFNAMMSEFGHAHPYLGSLIGLGGIVLIYYLLKILVPFLLRIIYVVIVNILLFPTPFNDYVRFDD